MSRLGAVPAWLGDPDLAVRRRLHSPSPDAVTNALDNGDLLKTYAFRGATHLLAAHDAGTYLAVRCANRQWKLPSWREHYRLSPTTGRSCGRSYTMRSRTGRSATASSSTG